MVIKLKRIFLILVIVTGLWFMFSYRLLQIPPGITSDEAAFGYNGALLAKTYHDENGRFMPLFVLSLGGQDWRQPVTQYSAALAFKIFGSSFYVLRSISVFNAILGIGLVFYLLYLWKGLSLAIFGALTLATTPILMIQSHMALDNIAPIPFIIVWILGIFLYAKTHQFRFLILSGIALGTSFYSYKAMRLFVPVWAIATVIYLVILDFKGKLVLQNIWHEQRKLVFSILTFSLALLPFLLVMPLIQQKYPGAILGGARLDFASYQHFILGWFSNLDPSFLFIKGDSTPYHSVGQYGALLLASFPLFLIGAYQAIKAKGFLLFNLICFLNGPILFGLVDSLDRASRLLAMLPSYAIVTSFGFWTIWNQRKAMRYKLLLGLFVILILLNYADFINYYWNKYAGYYKTQESFQTISHDSYLELAQQAMAKNLLPAVEYDVYQGDGVAAKFFEQAYFSKPLYIWHSGTPIPANTILLTNSEKLPGMSSLNLNLPKYHLLVSN